MVRGLATIPAGGSSTGRSSTDPAPQAPTQDIDNTVNTLNPSLVPEPWPSGYYFGDGSGGAYSKYPTLRRVGVGLPYTSPDKKKV